MFEIKLQEKYLAIILDWKLKWRLNIEEGSKLVVYPRYTTN